MSFQVVHRYQRAVDAGLADPLTCPEDDARLYTFNIGSIDDPVVGLQCYVCGTKMRLGLAALDQIKHATPLQS